MKKKLHCLHDHCIQRGGAALAPKVYCEISTTYCLLQKKRFGAKFDHITLERTAILVLLAFGAAAAAENMLVNNRGATPPLLMLLR
jgi:hypothetical protein